jgi:sialate O-acetylesterase
MFGSESKTTRTDAAGRWYVELARMPPSNEPADLLVQGDRALVIRNVLVGEVWLCSGQSNMARPMVDQPGRKSVVNSTEEIRTANHPQLRLFKVARAQADVPATTVGGQWMVCTPENLGQSHFSAVGYYYGRELHRELDVPIGLIDASMGSSRIESWTPAAGFAAVPSLGELAQAAQVPGTPAEGLVPSRAFNGMVHPLAPFAMRGVIWYQGENNLHDVVDGERYAEKMEALIFGWRSLWRNPELAFYYVQLAPHLYHVVFPNKIATPEALPIFWEAQTASLRIPYTGMVVTTDLVEDLFDIHPPRKREVGERLAQLALARSYDRKDIIDSGPRFSHLKIDGAKARIAFENVGPGLKTSDGKAPSWFTIAGADGIYFPAVAEIEGNEIVVASPHVIAPTAVRFGWDEAARPNLVNGAGLPAIPFRSRSSSVHRR